MENSQLTSMINDLKSSTERFRGSLQGKFNRNDKNAHITIQLVDNECRELQTKIDNILGIKGLSTGQDYATTEPIVKARDLIAKYDYVKNSGVPLDGNLLHIYANMGEYKRRKLG